MTRSEIEWTDEVWNPVTGCTKVSSGCAHCYAETVAGRWWGDRPFTEVRCHEDRLEKPLRWRKPRRVFVNSMSDLFHEDVPNEFIAAVFGVMACTLGQHSFQILTKRPDRMRSWFEWMKRFSWQYPELARGMSPEVGGCLHYARKVVDHPDVCGWNAPLIVSKWPLSNVWLGVSVEDQQTANERIPALLETPAAVRFVSAEPLLGRIRLNGLVHGEGRMDGLPAALYMNSLTGFRATSAWSGTTGPKLDWVIAGGESGAKARPCEVGWIRSLVEQCSAASVPVFVKQMGASVFDPDKGFWSPKPRGDGDYEYRMRTDGPALATVWRNGIWWTWDAEGVGGENSRASGVSAAKSEAEAALRRQHLDPIKGWRRHRSSYRDRKGANLDEWPEDLRVRQFPEVAPCT